MQPWMMVILIASILIIAAVAWLIQDRNRSRRLRERFGDEYDRILIEAGDRQRAESELEQREVHALQLRDRQLDWRDRDGFQLQWQHCQAQFVDDPAGALNRADQLLTELMRTRGYAAENPFDRMTDIAAAYPEHASRYRDASRIMARSRKGEVSTAELRQAFLDYRSLFDDVLGRNEVEEFKRAS